MTFALAWRNIWRQPRRSWLNIVAIGLTCSILIFLPALQLGSYQAMVSASISVLDGEAQIQQKDYLNTPAMRDSFSWNPKLSSSWQRSMPEVELAPRAVGFALLSSDERSFGVQIIGVDADKERRFSTIPKNVEKGRWLDKQTDDGIVMGDILAKNLKLSLGDRVTLLGSGRDGSLAVDSLVLVGTFNSGVKALNRQLAEINLSRFDQTFSMNQQWHAAVLLPKEKNWLQPWNNKQLSIELKQQMNKQRLTIRRWTELQPEIMSAIKIDMSSALAMYGVLILVVVFSLMNSTLMSVLERTREFGMMMALGTKSSVLSKIVWTESTMVATLGVIFGLVFGSLVTLYFEKYGITFDGAEAMFEQFGISSTIYPKLALLSLLPGPVVIFICLLLASVYPVSRIFRLQIIAAMRAV